MLKREKTAEGHHPRLLGMRRKGQNMVEFAFVSMSSSPRCSAFLKAVASCSSSARCHPPRRRARVSALPTRAKSSRPPMMAPTPTRPAVFRAAPHWDAPCTVVDQARARVVLLDQRAVNVEVSYDDGSSPKDPWNDGWMPGQDRIIVRAWYPFHFLLGLFDRLLPASGLTVEMVSARTIMVDEVSAPPAGQCTYQPGAVDGRLVSSFDRSVTAHGPVCLPIRTTWPGPRFRNRRSSAAPLLRLKR